MMFAPDWMMPALRLLDAETAHNLSLQALRRGFVGHDTRPDDPILAVQAFGRRLRNPIGLAAGFDKNAVAVNALGRLGFGFVETGTVTLRPQAGNPKPRLFRLAEDKAVINRMGFNNAGLEVYLENLRQVDRDLVVVGANVGINKENADPEQDYPEMVKAVAPYADYITTNVSSPNTPGLRLLQSEQRLAGILAQIHERNVVFVKISPDLSDESLEAVVEVAVTHGVAGLIISNTSTARPDSLRSALRHETGGLSGAPLFAPSTLMLARAYKLAGKRLVLIGAGGVSSGEEAMVKILAGATLVQIYTAFAYQGPGMVRRIKIELAEHLRVRDFASVAEAVGAGT